MSSEQGAAGQRSEASSLAAPAVALFVAILGFLPIANWIRGGHEAPWYALVTSGWLSGSAIAIGVGVVLAILARRIDLLWHDGALNRIVAAWARRPVVGADRDDRAAHEVAGGLAAGLRA